MSMPSVPKGNGAHPIVLVVVTAKQLDASSAFYSSIFGWQPMKMSAEVVGMGAMAGPMVALRSNLPDGFPGVVPYIGVKDVDAKLRTVVAAGATIEHASWKAPMLGTLARFKDASGTVYGLTDAMSPLGNPHVPMPFGDNPKPVVNTVCSLEMYTANDAGPQFFSEQFG